MYIIEVNNERVPPTAFTVSGLAWAFSFDLAGGEQVVVYTVEDGVPVRFDCYLARATPAKQQLLWETHEGRAYTKEEQDVMKVSLATATT